MKGVLRGLGMALLLGCVSIMAGADEQSRAPQEELELLMTYYRSPDPDRIVAVLRALDAFPFKSEAASPVLGFFYEIFRANPDRVPDWLQIISQYRQPELKRMLEKMAAIAVPNVRRRVVRGPMRFPSPKELDEQTAEDPDFCWGRFFATGDAKHVGTVLRYALSAKDKDDKIDVVAYAARWSLLALSSQQPEVETIFRERLARLSDDEVAFLLAGTDPPERERLLGRERAAKLPPPETVSRDAAAAANPFKGMFQEWKDRPDPNEAPRLHLERYIAELIRTYPESSPDDIRAFIARSASGGAADASCADPWAEAVRVSRLYAAGVPDAVKANRALIDRLPQGDLLRLELFRMGHDAAAPDSEERKQFGREANSEIREIVLKGRSHNAPFYWRLYNYLIESDVIGKLYWIILVDKAKPNADKLDPWFWEMAQGCAGIDAAWDGRGSGAASSVTKEGWDVFGDNLKAARGHFSRAIELFPERYGAYVQMITVEMGSGTVEARIKAFKKAAWYNASDADAWANILWSLQPRWCGSCKLIRMLAIEAMDCPRRDVGVAEMGYQALADIARFSNMRWQNVYRDPEVRERADRLFAEYEARAASATPEEQQRFLWHKFCRQMALLEYDAAAETFRACGGSERAVSERWFQCGHWFPFKIGTPIYDDPAMRLNVFTGPHAAELRAAEELFLSEADDRAALKQLAAVIRKDDLPPDEKEYLIDLYGRWRLDCEPDDISFQHSQSAYLYALRHDRADVAEELTKLGYRQKEQYPGQIVFCLAVSGDNLDEIYRRHAAGEDIDIVRERDGRSPLHLAAYNGHAKMVEALLKCGAKIDRHDRRGHTPLHLAASFKRGPAVRMLFKYGADPNAQDNDGDCALMHMAHLRALPDMFRLFLAHPKIDVNLRNKAGDNVLHNMAWLNTPVAIIRMMTDAGADCNLRNNKGKTPLDVAEERGSREAADFLRSVGGKRAAELPSAEPAHDDTVPRNE